MLAGRAAGLAGRAEARPVPGIPPPVLLGSPHQEIGQILVHPPPSVSVHFLQHSHKNNFLSPTESTLLDSTIRKGKCPNLTLGVFLPVCGFLNKYFMYRSGHILDLVVSGA